MSQEATWEFMAANEFEPNTQRYPIFVFPRPQTTGALIVLFGLMGSFVQARRYSA
jgi:hypothetical protein